MLRGGEEHHYPSHRSLIDVDERLKWIDELCEATEFQNNKDTNWSGAPCHLQKTKCPSCLIYSTDDLIILTYRTPCRLSNALWIVQIRVRMKKLRRKRTNGHNGTSQAELGHTRCLRTCGAILTMLRFESEETQNRDSQFKVNDTSQTQLTGSRLETPTTARR